MSIEQDVKDKVTSYVAAKFDNDPEKAFAAADEDKDGKLSLEEIEDFLEAAGVEFRVTRWVAAKAVMKAADQVGDGLLTYDELAKAAAAVTNSKEFKMGASVNFNFTVVEAYAAKVLDLLKTEGDTALAGLNTAFELFQAFTNKDLTGILTALNKGNAQAVEVIAAIEKTFSN